MNSKFFLKLSAIILAYFLLNFQATKSAGDTKALIKAASNGEYDLVLLTLVGESDINGQDATGLTPLMAAASNGHANVVNLLLEQPTINVNIQTNTGWTALIFAATNNYTEIMQMLLNRPNIDITLADTSHQTCVDYVMLSDEKAKMLPMLIKKIDQLIRSAILNEQVDKAQILHLMLVEKILKNGDTLIHWSVRNGDINLLKILYQNEPAFVAQSGERNNCGEAPLTMAQTKNREMYYFFIDKQIEANIHFGLIEQALSLHSLMVMTDFKNGDTILHWVVRNGDVATLGVLLKREPSLIKWIAAPNDLGEIPLVMSQGNYEMRSFLINQTLESHILIGEIDRARAMHSELVDTILQNEDTLVHWAVRNGNLDALKMLFTKMPHYTKFIDKKNKHGETPLSLADSNPMIYGYLAVLANGSKLTDPGTADFLAKVKMLELIARQIQSGNIAALQKAESKEKDKLTCAVCSKESHGQRCSKCQTRYYCSVACQKKDWHRHKHVCGKKS